MSNTEIMRIIRDFIFKSSDSFYINYYKFIYFRNRFKLHPQGLHYKQKGFTKLLFNIINVTNINLLGYQTYEADLFFNSKKYANIRFIINNFGNVTYTIQEINYTHGFYLDHLDIIQLQNVNVLR